jgi:predicted ArsR family transcriptional regulator
MSKTRQIILEVLSQRGPLPIGEIARAAHHSPMALRYHMTQLIAEGLVEVKDVAHRESVGRPVIRYALADKASERLPKQYDQLAVQLLDEINETLGEKDKRALLRRVGRRMAKTASAKWRKTARIEWRLERTVEFLMARGYMPHWEKHNGEHTLHICNCPYRQVALEHRQVCDMDIAMIAELLATPAKMKCCIANHDGQCVFSVKLSARTGSQ